MVAAPQRLEFTRSSIQPIFGSFSSKKSGPTSAVTEVLLKLTHSKHEHLWLPKALKSGGKQG
jgi:hypothetical protein